MTTATLEKPQSTSTVSARIVAAINEAHTKHERSRRNARKYAERCGRLLLEAKSLLPHGEWCQWLEKHFKGSRRTAEKYMRLVARVEEKANAPIPAHLGVDKALRLIATPSKKRRHRPATVADVVAVDAARRDDDGFSADCIDKYVIAQRANYVKYARCAVVGVVEAFQKLGIDISPEAAKQEQMLQEYLDQHSNLKPYMAM